jgi:hypothetical protein
MTEDKQFLYQPRFQLKGVRELLRDLDAARGCMVGQKTSKYLVAHRFVDDGITRETVDYRPMGNCHGWGKSARERSPYGKRPIRRIRVWVHACEVVRTEWDAQLGRYFVERYARAWNEGVVSDWLVLDGHDVAPAYNLELAPLVLEGPSDVGTGVYVVFTAIEVSEKQGRHWVRLPFVCKMRVAESVDAEELAPDSNRDSNEKLEMSAGRDARAVLVAVPGRVEVGMNRREFSFEEFELHLRDLQVSRDFVFDGIFEGNLVEVKARVLSGHLEQSGCGYRGDGVLVRAGP